MNDAQYSLYLSIATWICAAGALFNLTKLRRRGNAALLLSSAFLALGLVFWLVKTKSSEALITGGTILVAALLIADLFVRSRQQERPQ